MACDAPLIGLNAPLKNHCLVLGIFGALFDLPIHAVIKECMIPETSGFTHTKKKERKKKGLFRPTMGDFNKYHGVRGRCWC